MTPPVACASASARADFPAAVGPAMTWSTGLSTTVVLTHPAGLPSTLADRATAQLGTGSVAWLDAPHALRIEDVPADAAARLQGLAAEADIFVRPANAPPPRLFVADMDSTMIGCECIDELADYAGRKAEIAAITARAMRGELDFAEALRARVEALAGLAEAAIDQCLAERVRPNPGAATLVATLKAQGIRTVLVTGGFTRFAQPVAAMLGFDRVVANQLAVANSRLTGEVAGPIVDAATKRAVLLEEAQPLGGPAVAIAMGDGANDIPMLEAAGLGVAYRAKPVAVAAADAHIAHGDLTTLLWWLGLPRARWATLP